MVSILSRRSQQQQRRDTKCDSRICGFLPFASRSSSTSKRIIFLSLVITIYSITQQTIVDVGGRIFRRRRETSSADSINRIGGSNHQDSKEYYDFFNITFLDNIQTMKCGGRKCFIQNAGDGNEKRSSSNNNKQIGYIIAQDNRIKDRENPISSDMYKAWDIAKTLKQQYNSSTLLLGPPHKLYHKDELFFDKLNSIKIQSDPGHFIPQGVGKFSIIDPLIIQPTQIIPQPSMMWHINMYLSNEDYRKPMLYADFISNNNHVVNDNIKQFELLLMHNLNTTKHFLAEQYPCLLNDLQFIIDSKGNIHHIDLDRCYDISTTEIAKKRIAYMNIFDDAVQQFKVAIRIAKSLQ